MPRITAIVLAAGLSRRMGEKDKLFLPIGCKPMVKCVIDEVTNSQVFETIIVTSKKTHQKLEGCDRRVLNEDSASGMTSSIQMGILAASHHSEAYMICLGDMPFIQTTTYNEIINGYTDRNQSQIVVPYHKKSKGNPVIFSADFREELLACQEKEGCRSVIQNNSHLVDKIQLDDPTILRDIDTEEDYRGLIGNV